MANIQNRVQTASPSVGNILKPMKFAFLAVALFSMVINLLLLVSPLYMLQIYDRVLSSGSEETLIMLTIIAVFLLVILGTLDAVRSRIMIRIGLGLNENMREGVFERLFVQSLRRSGKSHTQALRDLETIRQFLSGNSLFAFFDAPWTPLFIVLIFYLHPLLGFISLCGAILIFSFALITELVSRKQLGKAATHSIRSYSFAESSLRNSDVLKAMGMLGGIQRRWHEQYAAAANSQTCAGERVGMMLGASKALRFILQSAILGAGAWLALKQVITPGVMIAASIIMGRALAPVEQAIGSWRSFLGCRVAWGRLQKLYTSTPDNITSLQLPRPEGLLEVKNVSAKPQGSSEFVLKSVSFSLNPGESLAVIGPSGAGKTTLARLLVGVWPTQRGEIRLDNADITSFNDDYRNQYIGYLPQDIELFSGMVKANIARFTDVDEEKTLQATIMSGCHETILELSQGYETMIGDDGNALSGGQRQRIALARALYGGPAFVVLDEPSASLDTKGEEALVMSIKRMKENKITLVVVSHNRRITSVVDKILILEKGQILAFGPRKEILERLYGQIPARK